MNAFVPDERLHYLAQHLHDLGPRPVLEFIKEIVAGHDPVQRLEVYSRLDPGVVRALCGDQIYNHFVIEGGRQWE